LEAAGAGLSLRGLQRLVTGELVAGIGLEESTGPSLSLGPVGPRQIRIEIGATGHVAHWRLYRAGRFAVVILQRVDALLIVRQRLLLALNVTLLQLLRRLIKFLARIEQVAE